MICTFITYILSGWNIYNHETFPGEHREYEECEMTLICQICISRVLVLFTHWRSIFMTANVPYIGYICNECMKILCQIGLITGIGKFSHRENPKENPKKYIKFIIKPWIRESVMKIWSLLWFGTQWKSRQIYNKWARITLNKIIESLICQAFILLSPIPEWHRNMETQKHRNQYSWELRIPNSETIIYFYS